jgi:hypothetical protein
MGSIGLRDGKERILALWDRPICLLLEQHVRDGKAALGWVQVILNINRHPLPRGACSPPVFRGLLGHVFCLSKFTDQLWEKTTP